MAMKKFLTYGLAICVSLPLMTSCLGDDPTNDDNPWKEQNDNWIISKALEKDADGNPVYDKVTCPWDPNAYVLMKWHNDRSQTASKLSPMSTSTIDVRYEVSTIDGTEVDDSKSNVNPAPGIYRSTLNKNIEGWIIGISNMHVGDTCTILIPYNQAYGSMTYNGLKAYSSLVFNVRLVDIPAWEKPI